MIIVRMQVKTAELKGAAGENQVHSISTMNSTPAYISITGNVSQPDKNFKFPETTHKKQKRSSRNHWFEKYQLLEYDIHIDSVKFHVCKRQNVKSNELVEHVTRKLSRKKRYLKLEQGDRKI